MKSSSIRSLIGILLWSGGIGIASAFTVDGLNYSASGNVATVTGIADKTMQRLVIPNEVEYGGKIYQVDFLAAHAFKNCTNIKEVIVADSPRRLQAKTYSLSGSLAMGLPFEGCCPEKIYIGRNYFQYNSAGGINLEDYVAFASSAPSVEVTIGGEATEIPFGNHLMVSFWGWPNLTSLIIGGKVEKIGKTAFENTTGLRRLEFLPGENPLAFEDGYAFNGTQLDSLIWRRGFKSGSYMDQGIKSISTLLIGKEMVSLPRQSYTDLKVNHSFIVEDSENPLQISGRILVNLDLDSIYYGRPIEGNDRIAESSKTRSLAFGGTIKTINKNYTNTLTGFSNVWIGEGVDKIEAKVFYSFPTVSEVHLPATIREIGDNAFNGCRMDSVDLPEGLEIIGSGAFGGTKLKSLILPASLHTIGYQAFANIDELETVEIRDSENELNCNYTGTGIFNYSNIGCLYLGREISDEDFASYAHIREFTVGNNLRQLKKWFGRVYDLEVLFLYPGLEEIDGTALQFVSTLKEIEIMGENPPLFTPAPKWNKNVLASATVFVPRGRVGVFRDDADWSSGPQIRSHGNPFNVKVNCPEGNGLIKLNGEEVMSMDVCDGDALRIECIAVEGHRLESLEINDLEIDLPTDCYYIDIPHVCENMVVKATFGKNVISQVGENSLEEDDDDVFLYDLSGYLIGRESDLPINERPKLYIRAKRIFCGSGGVEN